MKRKSLFSLSLSLSLSLSPFFLFTFFTFRFLYQFPASDKSPMKEVLFLFLLLAKNNIQSDSPVGTLNAISPTLLWDDPTSFHFLSILIPHLRRANECCWIDRRIGHTDWLIWRRQIAEDEQTELGQTELGQTALGQTELGQQGTCLVANGKTTM